MTEMLGIVGGAVLYGFWVAIRCVGSQTHRPVVEQAADAPAAARVGPRRRRERLRIAARSVHAARLARPLDGPRVDTGPR